MITGDLPQSAIEAFIGYLYDTARASDASPWWMLIDVHGDVNSAVTKVPTDATSYVHRDKLWIFQFSGTIKDGVNVAESMDFVKGFMNSIKDNMGEYVWGRYANYVDSELNRDDAQNQYWGKHLDRLQAIKADVDPDELFYNPQSVKPAN